MAVKKKPADPAAGDHVRLPHALVAKLRLIAAAARRTMGDLVNEYAGAKVDAEYRKVLRERSKAAHHDLGGEG